MSLRKLIYSVSFPISSFAFLKSITRGTRPESWWPVVQPWSWDRVRVHYTVRSYFPGSYYLCVALRLARSVVWYQSLHTGELEGKRDIIRRMIWERSLGFHRLRCVHSCTMVWSVPVRLRYPTKINLVHFWVVTDRFVISRLRWWF
jgi:hypothetical protein